MLNANSPLRCIPVNLDINQTVFFDGLRHAAEIAEFALDRLKTTLAAFEQFPDDVEGNDDFARALTSAFLDGWTVIDSSYRFVNLRRRSLVSI